MASEDPFDPLTQEPIPSKFVIRVQDCALDVRSLVDYLLSVGHEAKHPLTRVTLTPSEVRAIFDMGVRLNIPNLGPFIGPDGMGNFAAFLKVLKDKSRQMHAEREHSSHLQMLECELSGTMDEFIRHARDNDNQVSPYWFRLYRALLIRTREVDEEAMRTMHAKNVARLKEQLSSAPHVVERMEGVVTTLDDPFAHLREWTPLTTHERVIAFIDRHLDDPSTIPTATTDAGAGAGGTEPAEDGEADEDEEDGEADEEDEDGEADDAADEDEEADEEDEEADEADEEDEDGEDDEDGEADEDGEEDDEDDDFVPMMGDETNSGLDVIYDSDEEREDDLYLMHSLMLHNLLIRGDMDSQLRAYVGIMEQDQGDPPVEVPIEIAMACIVLERWRCLEFLLRYNGENYADEVWRTLMRTATARGSAGAWSRLLREYGHYSTVNSLVVWRYLSRMAPDRIVASLEETCPSWMGPKREMILADARENADATVVDALVKCCERSSCGLPAS